jgi:RHS repeat-associated protein
MYTLKLGMRLLHLAVIVSFLLPAPAQAGVLLLQEAEVTLTPTPTAEETPAPAETITPTLTLTPTATLLPTETYTPTPTETPTPPVDTPTPTPTYAPSATPTATVTPTASPTPSETPAEEPADTPGELGLILEASAKGATPGGLLTLHWQALGWQDAQTGLSLSLLAPPGVSTADVLMDPRTGAYDFMVQSADDTLQWQLPVDLAGPYTFTATLSLDGAAVISRTMTVTESGLTRVPVEGGAAKGLDGKVQVIFPEKAAGEALDVRVRNPIASNMPPRSLSDHPFEIVASLASEGPAAEVHTFAEPLTIEVAYNGLREPGIYYYDPEKKDWFALPTVYDRKAGVLRAWSDHLSVFDIEVNSWQSAQTPTLDGFQVSQQTGAATYSFPIWTPPGPGGLQPSLAFSYNSQIVDSAIAPVTQGSWVGMGWSLDTGAITRNMNGTTHDLSDDTYSLVINGVSGMLLRDSNGVYHFSDKNFWKVVKNGETSWEVWDKSGNKYVFGNNYRAQFEYCGEGGDPTAATRLWPLVEIVNKEGKKITFEYARVSRELMYYCANPGQVTVHLAVYPTKILYPHDRYYIQFTREGGRTDFDHKWDDDTEDVAYETDHLSKIEIMHDADGAGGSAAAVAVRSYELDYDAMLFPNVEWSGPGEDPGGRTYTLSRILTKGLNGAALPATTFTYDDLHLILAENGYGGSVSFDYDPFPWYEQDTIEDLTGEYVFRNDTDECDDWIASSGESCAYWNDTGPLVIQGATYKSILRDAVRPGTAYSFEIDIWRNTPLTATPTFGFEYASGQYETITIPLSEINDSNINIYAPLHKSGVLILPSDAAYTAYYGTNPEPGGYPRMVVTCQDCRASEFVIKQLTTRYRVRTRGLSDSATGESHLFHYEYDDAATNDAEHSAAVAAEDPEEDDDLYEQPYTEYRGAAMSRETGPADAGGLRRTTTTWYAQDDVYKGQPVASLSGTQVFTDTFTTLNTSQWEFNPAGACGIGCWFSARQSGDAALKTDVFTMTNWAAQAFRTDASVSDDEAILLSFRLKDLDASRQVETYLAAEYLQYSEQGFLRWGLRVLPGGEAKAGFTSGGVADEQPLGLTLQQETWYTLLLVMDNQHLTLLLWPRDDPAGMVRREISSPAGVSANTAWTFRFWVNGSGSAWMDDYSEGQVYNLSYTGSSVDSYALGSPFNGYLDLGLRWTRPISETRMSFEGDGSWTGVRTTYDYLASYQGGAQYGNLTHQVEAAWNGSAWVDYRAALTWYYPNTSGVYLTGLPAASNRYKCNGAPCDYEMADLLSSRWNLYDGATNYTSAPTAGRLTGERDFVCFADGNGTCYLIYQSYQKLMYADRAYAYDAWGNRTTVTAYTDYADTNNFANHDPLKARTAYTCYGSANQPAGCADDGYHTYALWEKNPLNQQTTWDYNGVISPGSAYKGYAIAAPVSETDANGIITVAEYDLLGRMTKIIRPGDSSASPTLTFAYYDAASPFYTQATQKIDASTSFVLRKYYDGLGRMVQTRVVGAKIGTLTKDIKVDTYYNAYNQIVKQSAPYDVLQSEGFGRSGGFTTTSAYDALGRVSKVTAPDTTYTETTYGDLQAAQRDPRGNLTTTLYDVWGRSVQITPPAGPGVSYTYDELDRLLTSNYGGVTSSLTYDWAGRKKKMVDADMGTWYYVYDGMGNLIRQKDARLQRICLYYDDISRLVGKHYRTDDNCPAAYAGPGVTYSYDATTGSNYGIGRRTGMIDASGSTAWKYDSRGRLIQESKAVTGSGTFVTQWTYNSADLPVSMRYPADNNSGLGETVSYTYRPQMLVNTVVGTNVYVNGSEYDAAGRLDVRWLGWTGSSAVIKTDNDYFDWNFLNGSGRLKAIKAGVPGNYTSLQDLQYYSDTGASAYDAAGNLLKIYDYKAGAPQTQSFTYDAANRLASAQASGTVGLDGAYNLETYTYDSAGRLVGMPGLGTYTYSSSHPHAVEQIGGVTRYSYDANGSMTQRIYGANTYNFTYDAENHLTGVSGGATNTYAYDGDGNRVKETSYENVASGQPAASDTTLYWGSAASDNDTYADSGAQTSGEFAYTGSGLHYAQIDLGAVFTVDKVKVWHYHNDGRTYHNTKTQVSADGVSWYTVFDSATQGEYAETAAGKTHSFTARSVRYVRDYANGNTYNANNHWVEIEVFASRTTAHIGGYFEWSGSTGTMVKYYQAGGQAVAMRTGAAAPVFLLHDHLGSLKLTADGTNGTKLSELRYKPWGELRYAWNATPSPLRYTAQRGEGMGLYDYHARFYDPSLGRFAQADTLIPSAAPLAWDRYAGMMNNPVRYRDPSGHWVDEVDFDDPFFRNQGLLDDSGNYFYNPKDAKEAFGVATPMRVSIGTAVQSTTTTIAWPNGTLSLGFGGAGFGAVGVRGEGSVAIDANCNIAGLRSFGGGGYSAVGVNRFGPSLTVTNAPTVLDLEGWSVQFGGQVGDVASIGGEGILFRDEEGIRYGGATIAGGAALMGPWPGELHATLTHTDLLWLYNPCEKLLDLLQQ